MPGKFLTDAEMAAHEASQPATASAAPKFMSDADMEVHEASAGDSGPSTLEALARGAGQGVTAGFGEEGSGGLSAAFDKASGNDASLLDLYHKYRDADRAKNEAAHKAHPWAYTAGNIVGSIPMMAATAGLGGALGIGGEAGTLGRAVAQGAADAGLMGAGNSNADLTSGKLSDAKQFGKDVGGSMLLGGGTGVLAHGLSGAANEIVAPYLKKKAEDAAIKHLRPTPKLKMALGDEGVRDAAREALDSGAIQPWKKADQTAANLENLVNETGAVKGDIVDASPAQIDPANIANKVDSEVIAPLRKTAAGRPIADSIDKQKEAFLTQYGGSQEGPSQMMTPSQLEAEKTAVQGNINYKTDASAPIDAQKGYARILKEGSEDAITDPNFVRAKDAYGNLKTAQTMADRTGALTDGGGLLGHLTDVSVGTEALREVANGNPAGLALGAGRAVTKGRLSSTAAVGLDKLSRIIQTNPQAMGKYAPILKNAAARGSSALAATHFILSQTEPEYREQSSQAAGGDQ